MARAAAVEEGADPEMAGRLRLARRLSSRTLREVAGEAGTSESMLSKIENAKASPSIQTLCRLAAALGRPVAWFFGSDGGPVMVSAAASRVVAPGPAGIEPVVALAGLDASVVHLRPGGEPWSPDERPGVAFAMVLEGAVVLGTSGESVPLAAGDAVASAGSCPRPARATGGPARLLVVHAAGSAGSVRSAAAA